MTKVALVSLGQLSRARRRLMPAEKIAGEEQFISRPLVSSGSAVKVGGLSEDTRAEIWKFPTCPSSKVEHTMV